jgi:hypothetical protein
MENIEELRYTHRIVAGGSPKGSSLAIVSASNSGRPGELNSYVMNECGYSPDEFPGKELLSNNFYLLKKDSRIPILFIVTVGRGDTAKSLEGNLRNAIFIHKPLLDRTTIWLPLMGTGAGGLSPEQSYSITARVLNDAKLARNTTFLISVPSDVLGEALLKKLSQIRERRPVIEKSEIKRPDLQKPLPSVPEIIERIKGGANKNFWWLNANPDYWKITDFKIGKQQSYTTHNEIGNPRRMQDYFFEARPGDLMIGYETQKNRRVVALLEVTKEAVNRNGDELFFRVIHFFERQITWDELNRLERFRNTNMARNNTGSLFKLDFIEFTEILRANGFLPSSFSGDDENHKVKEPEGGGDGYNPRMTYNLLKRASIDNDGAQSEHDLLDFTNDIRAFSSLIALKELKPPLAIALFGKWGSGKSFFMYNLQKQIGFLSKHQGFEEFVELKEGERKEEEPFCNGIAQICFNAWSYMDANLWASLVANIFEKLDEYITEQTKGENALEEVRKVLNEKLSIVNEEKERTLRERETLVSEKDQLIKDIERLEIEKNDLLKKTTKEKLNEIYSQVKAKIPLEETLEQELKKYGISGEHLREISPETIYHETRSWSRFAANLLRFSPLQLCTMGLGCLVLLLIAFIPSHVLSNYVSLSKGLIVSFFSVAGPLFAGFYKTFQQFNRLYEPVKTYRDKFNNELERNRLEYESQVNEVNKKLKMKADELNNKDSKLLNLDEQIKMIGHEMKYSIAGKAFFNFISGKAKDERYEKNQGIISVIRKDFETLSELFRDYNIPSELQGKELEEAEKRKEEQEKFRQLFMKPLDRIVLYIDDLDRCPEDRVIEVLEAVNLLMAYPLFVVVVGVDPRWVKNALIKKYTLQFTGLLNNEQKLKEYGVEPIHVTDYLEKIFQIPFHLNEANEDGVDKLLENIFEKQLKGDTKDEAVISLPKKVEATEEKQEPVELRQKMDVPQTESLLNLSENLGALNSEYSFDVVNTTGKKVHFRPEDLKITRQELEDLKDLAWLVGNNPRSLKRYANMYRLVRAHENLNYSEHSERQDFLAVMFILGIAIGEHKQLAAKFYRLCQERPDSVFAEIAEEILNIPGKTFAERMEKKELPLLLRQAKGRVFSRYIPFVKRFSFENVS